MIKNRSSKLELWKKSFLLAVPLSALTAVVLLLIFQMDVRNQLQKVELSEEHNLQILAEHEQDEFEHIVTDLRVLSEHHELKKYLQQASYADIHDLHNDWGALQESRKVYDQIRFIDSSGQERIRLNLSNGSSVTVPETQLQSKSSRYYFKDTIGLDPGDIFVSPLDLNVENGRIEEPHKPMIRFGSPVFDQDGQTRGIIILNYLADDLILPMKNDLHGFSWGDVMLINADGYWLSHPVADKEWGFMLNSDERIGNDYPLAWARIAHSEEGTFHTDHGLFTYTTISPLTRDGQAAIGSAALEVPGAANRSQHKSIWKLIAYVPQAKLAALTEKLKFPLAGLWGGLTLLYLMISLGLTKILNEKRAALLEIQEREETIHLLLNSTAEGIYGVDQNGLCIFFNHAAQDLLDYAEEQVIGRSIHELIWHTAEDGSRQSKTTCIVRAVLASGEGCGTRNGILWRSDNSFINVEYSVHPLLQKNQVVGAVVNFSDVTEKRKMHELQLRTSQLSALGEVASGVAHEINNPINGVINYAQLLLNRQADDSRDRKILQCIIREGSRIGAIVKNLLHFSQKDRGLQETLKLRAIIEEPLNLMYQQLKNDDIHLDVEVSDELPEIYGNTLQLEQVVLNLFSNARHALNKKFPEAHIDKILRVGAHTVEKGSTHWLQLVFYDQGCGISEDHIKKVFNPFFTTKEAGVGTGLGLSVSSEILTNHKARFFIESEEGQYTKVLIEFPMASSLSTYQETG